MRFFLSRERIIVVALFGFVAVLMLFALAGPIDLVTADLGRHLKNGEMLFSTATLVRTNFYSYTAPDFPTTNHHWGSGALFYFVWKLVGFTGVQIFFLAIAAAALALFWRIARSETNAWVASLASLAAIPFIAERAEVRPEILSSLFAGLFLMLLLLFRAGRISRKRLFIALAIVQVLWVNAHIYFFLGLAIIAAFAVEALIRERSRLKDYALALALCTVASFINPFGAAGALAPLTIFKNYGYPLLENQTVWFLDSRIDNPVLFFFKLAFALAVVALAIALIRRNRSFPLVYLFLFAGFSVMAWLQLRNFALFGFFFIPIFAAAVWRALTPRMESAPHPLETLNFKIAGATALLAIGLLASSGALAAVLPRTGSGIGLAQGALGAADFLNREHITGPIFNNYDIGGYLIFALYPRERVFVDNRPEAYPPGFFQDTYIPMQEDDAKWREQEGKYRFNAIVFSHRDLTPWGQGFLVRRVADPEWAPVFVDGYVVVFLRRVPTNSEIIKKYEVPKSVFSIRNP